MMPSLGKRQNLTSFEPKKWMIFSWRKLQEKGHIDTKK